MMFHMDKIFEKYYLVKVNTTITITFANLTQSSITWEVSLNKGLSWVGMNMDVSVRGCLSWVNYWWRHSPLWTAPFPRQRVWSYAKVEKYSTADQGKWVCIHLFLSALDCGRNMTSCLKFLDITWKCEPFLSCFLSGYFITITMKVNYPPLGSVCVCVYLLLLKCFCFKIKGTITQNKNHIISVLRDTHEYQDFHYVFKAGFKLIILLSWLSELMFRVCIKACMV